MRRWLFQFATVLIYSFVCYHKNNADKSCYIVVFHFARVDLKKSSVTTTTALLNNHNKDNSTLVH